MINKIKSSAGAGGSIIRAEWSNLFKNKMLLVSLIVISFIPILYSGFFLGSIWDPYGQTAKLPVAFVNEDRGAILNGKQVNMGQSLTQELKNNKDLGWEFVSKEQADRGVASGYFYATVTVPADFSSQVASIASDQPKQATIQYTTTPSKNYIGSLISSQAADKLKASVSKQVTQAYIKGIFANLNKLGSGFDEASRGASSLYQGAVSVQGGLTQYGDGVNRLAVNQKELTGALGQLSGGAYQLQTGIEQISSNLPSEIQLAQLNSGMTTLQSGINRLNLAVQNPSPEIAAKQASIAKKVNDLTALMGTMTGDLQSSGALLQNLAQQASVSGGSTTITLPQIQIISKSVQNISTISAQLNGLLADLQSLMTDLAAWQGQLKSGVATLNNGVNQLAPAATSAFNGYDKLRIANKQILTGSSTLYNGLVAAEQGSAKLSDGAALLGSRSNTLLGGASQLAGGINALTVKLDDASDQVKSQSTGGSTQQQIADPVQLQATTNGDVRNYGHALAPYVLSLSLFVGALVFNVIYPIRKTFAKQQNAFRWWLAKASVIGVASFVQATILMLIMIFGLGLSPEHPAQFVGAIYLTSLTYMSIVSLLVIALDNVGRFLAMILLVVQLGSSEGTFPIQTAPEFLQAINPFVPMTYSIRALREAISGGLSSSFYTNSAWILVIILVVVNILMLGYFAHYNRLKQANLSK